MNDPVMRPLGVASDGEGFAVRSIAVIGSGMVGVPMAALLANARIRMGTAEPARVVLVERGSALGWRVAALTEAGSLFASAEPGLAEMIRECVAAGLLSVTGNYAVCREADVILICVQTEVMAGVPDYAALHEALHGVALAVAQRPTGAAPLVVIESMLAPSSFNTIVLDAFRKRGLVDGHDMYLAYSPHRVMPGRLLERVTNSDKIIAAPDPEAQDRISRVYRHIVTRGALHLTNPLTAEFTSTLENAYRDVRIALSSEAARYCDARDIDFYALREWVNGELLQRDVASFHATAVPRGGLLVPSVGVGGHALPRDGYYAWWRAHELGAPSQNSLILEARRINDESPFLVGNLADGLLQGPVNRKIALLGTAYRFHAGDACNSPTIALARDMRKRGAIVSLHDPYVRPDDAYLRRAGISELFTNDLDKALDGAELAIVCAAHRDYAERVGAVLSGGRQLHRILDAAHAYEARLFADSGVEYSGIGRGTRPPPNELCQIVYDAFRVVERGFANEAAALIQHVNARYALHDFDKARVEHVQYLAGTCPTGCAIADAGHAAPALDHGDFTSRLVARATAATKYAAAARRSAPSGTRRPLTPDRSLGAR
ncbi:MAG TPA: nucleotide sugar dehydrogenase [Gemmatimonadaceae bacterium]|nr:nucleotide sugar dehydrogenase [Gemmatimonadaceae bacterium]